MGINSVIGFMHLQCYWLYYQNFLRFYQECRVEWNIDLGKEEQVVCATLFLQVESHLIHVLPTKDEKMSGALGRNKCNAGALWKGTQKFTKGGRYKALS